MIVVSKEMLTEHLGSGNCLPVSFRRLDGSETYSAINAEDASNAVLGSILYTHKSDCEDIDKFGTSSDEVRLIVSYRYITGENLGDNTKNNRQCNAKGYIRADGQWREVSVSIVPLREELFSRTRGIFETDVLADKWVFTAGLGSGGSPIVLELAKLGLNQMLVDHDRIEVANVARHAAGLSDVGRYKTNFLAEKILDKNPDAKVETDKAKISWDNQDLVRQMVQRSDIVICAVDDFEARIILNKLCLEENKPLIIAGAFRRAYGGQVLRILPGITPCYGCFLEALPDQVQDQEISTVAHAQRLAYSDQPVAIEPGLSNDILPISQMVVKLAIQQLLTGYDTTFRSMDEDLVAPWYIWLNRRESSTPYEKLVPLEFNVDGMHIMRWYGIDLPRNPSCPCCGDFTDKVAEKEGIVINMEDQNIFAGGEGEA